MKVHRSYEAEHTVHAAMRRLGAPESALPKVFVTYDANGAEALHIFVSREEWTPGDERWHISIKARDRVPTWDEVAAACHETRPGVPFVLGVPPRSQWMNVHEHVLHAWECKDHGLLAQWRAEARGDRPT